MIILERDNQLSLSRFDMIMTRQRKKMYCDASVDIAEDETSIALFG